MAALRLQPRHRRGGGAHLRVAAPGFRDAGRARRARPRVATGLDSDPGSAIPCRPAAAGAFWTGLHEALGASSALLVRRIAAGPRALLPVQERQGQHQPEPEVRVRRRDVPRAPARCRTVVVWWLLRRAGKCIVSGSNPTLQIVTRAVATPLWCGP